MKPIKVWSLLLRRFNLPVSYYLMEERRYIYNYLMEKRRYIHPLWVNSRLFIFIIWGLTYYITLKCHRISKELFLISTFISIWKFLNLEKFFVSMKRGTGIWSFLDNRGHYSGTWRPIMAKFCMMGAFLSKIQNPQKLRPSNLYRGQSSRDVFLAYLQPHINVSIKMLLPCEKITSKT